MGGKPRYLYGLLSLLSLLGFLGIFTQERLFLVFFVFLVDVKYFFQKSDEMLEGYMNRAAAWGFYLGMVATALLALAAFFLGEGQQALVTGIAGGWGVAIAVHALAELCYTWKEGRGVDDPD